MFNPVQWWIEWDGFLTKEGRFLDPKEWHSFMLGVMSGWRNKHLNKSWVRDKQRMHHELEFQYYEKGWLIGKRVPYCGTFFVAGLITGILVGIGGFLWM